MQTIAKTKEVWTDNSKLLNYIFKQFSTNSDENGYGVDNILIQHNESGEILISSLVTQILTHRGKDSNIDTSIEEQELGRLVYHLYGLTYDEVNIVDSDTPITEKNIWRKNYENTNNSRNRR